jgi:hypothetical protein
MATSDQTLIRDTPMTDEIKRSCRCNCQHCRVAGLMGPIMLITVGAIFLVGQYTRYSMGDLWPLFLIIPGVVLLAQGLASKECHISK